MVRTVGPHSITLTYQPDTSVIYCETTFGMIIRYEADMEFFFLACLQCRGRLEAMMGKVDPCCRKCRKEHRQYTGVIPMMPGQAVMSNVVQSWAQDFLDPFEVVITAEFLAQRLRKIHSFLHSEDDSRYKDYDKACRKYSGSLEP